MLVYHVDVEEADRYRFTLARLDVDVTIAVALDDALALVERLRPPIVASARVAVTPSGYDCRFLGALRALPPGRGGATPAIALTPWAGREARDGMLALGFTGHVGAPCSPEAVAAEISRVAPGRATAAG